jgi:hypothetical protein
MTTQTIEFNKYTTIVSLGERNIYLKFTDQINFVNFESNVDAKELRLQFDLSDIYKLICDALSGLEGYNVAISVNNGFMKLAFHLLVGGFLTVKFEAVLKEKLLSNDGQLTINFNKLEQKYDSLMKKLESLERKITTQQEENMVLIEAISNTVIDIDTGVDVHSPDSKSYLLCKINTTSLKFKTTGSIPPVLSNIQYLYKLEKLKITSENGLTISEFSNKMLKELEVHGNSFKNMLNNLTYNFPNLETLSITHQSFDANQNLIQLLALSSGKDKIKTITLQKAAGYNVSELQNYCHLNNIILNIS